MPSGSRIDFQYVLERGAFPHPQPLGVDLRSKNGVFVVEAVVESVAMAVTCVLEAVPEADVEVLAEALSWAFAWL